MEKEKRRILVIEDEIDTSQLIKARLEANSYQVITALDSDEGLRKTSFDKPDLVVLDLMLPGIGGYELCARLKADKETMNIPIIMLTARAGDIDRKMGFQCGADSYMPKPFEGTKLMSEISRLLEIR